MTSKSEMEEDSRRPRREKAQPSWVLANGHIVSESAALKRALKESLLESQKEKKQQAGRRRRATESPQQASTSRVKKESPQKGSTKETKKRSLTSKTIQQTRAQIPVKRKNDSRDETTAAGRRDKRMKFRRDFLEDTMREINRSPKKKYCAQRKFALNCNGGYSSSPMSTPIKAFLSPGPSNPPPPLILPAAATQTTSPLKPTCKTEDFLTFLCLRGTSLCPDDLKFLENPTTFEPKTEDKASIIAKTKRNLQGKLSEVDDTRQSRKVRESIDNGNRKDIVNHVAKLITAKYKKNINGVSHRLSTRQSSSDSRSSISTLSRAERLKLRQRKVAQREKENKRKTKQQQTDENGHHTVAVAVAASEEEEEEEVEAEEELLKEVENSVAQRRTALIRSQSRRTQQNSRRMNLIARSLIRKAKSTKSTKSSPTKEEEEEEDDDEEEEEEGEAEKKRRATRSLGPIAEVALPIWPQYKLKQYELSLSKKTKRNTTFDTLEGFVEKPPKKIEKRRSERVSSSTDCTTSSTVISQTCRKTIRPRAAKTIAYDNILGSNFDSDRMNSIFLGTCIEDTEPLNGLISSQFEGAFAELSTFASTSSISDTPVKTSLNFMTDCGSPSGSIISRVSDTSFRKSTSSADIPCAGPKVSKSRKNQVRWSIGDQSSSSQTPVKCEMRTCLVFEPTVDEFQHPLRYIRETSEKIDKTKHSMFKIIPPKPPKDSKSTAKALECQISQEMRFLAYNQYLHKMWRRWGPAALQYACLRKALKISQGTEEKPEESQSEDKVLYKRGCPLIGGVEVDVAHLYATVQNFGGIQQVMEKKKWVKVADAMRIPRMAHDRVARLDDAYMRYCLPLEVMSELEKENVFKKVKEDHERRRTDNTFDENETLECVWPGRNMTLAVFERVARNIHTMWYKSLDDSKLLVEDVEHDFWALVEARKRHVVVNCGNIDTLAYGCGFPQPSSVVVADQSKKKKAEESPAKADKIVPWNTKVLAQHQDNVLRWLGDVSGVTIPTLHVSMLFTSLPWYRDPHNVNWLDYLHSGASRIWYSVPADQAECFHHVVSRLAPHVHQSDIGIPSDACLIPPKMLLERGVQLERIEQRAGEIMVILDGCYSSNINCGYSISESVYFTWDDWLSESWQRFNMLRENSEPPTFCLERLIVNIALAGTTKGSIISDNVLQDVNGILVKIIDELGSSWSYLEKEGVPMERWEQTNKFPMECSSCRLLCGLAVGTSQDTADSEEFQCLPCAQQRLETQLTAASVLKSKKQKTNAQPKPSSKFKVVYCYNMEELKTLSNKLQQKLI